MDSGDEGVGGERQTGAKFWIQHMEWKLSRHKLNAKDIHIPLTKVLSATDCIGQ
jgi:hypothetical protein